MYNIKVKRILIAKNKFNHIFQLENSIQKLINKLLKI
jgi:hypothetical protein